MGLDTIELVMEVEDTFQIRIDDRDAEKIRTVGGLVDYVWDRCNSAAPVCATSRAFYSIRRALMQGAGLGRSLIRPTTRTADLLHPGIRRIVWAAMRAQGVGVPALVFSNGQVCVLLGAVLTMAAVVPIAISAAGAPFVVAAFSLPVAAVGTAIAVYRPLSRRAMTIPAYTQTIGDLALAAARPAPDAGLTRHEVEQRIRWIVSEQLAVPLEKVTPGASFVRDLGAG